MEEDDDDDDDDDDDKINKVQGMPRIIRSGVFGLSIYHPRIYSDTSANEDNSFRNHIR